jgi:predicted nucleic acid-binding protein
VRVVTVTRVVPDTHVPVAAAYNPAGSSRRVVGACQDGERTPALSPALRHEYEFILARADRGQPYLERVHRLVDGTEIVEPGETLRVVADEREGDKPASVALAAGAILVTHDAHLLAIAGHEGLKVARPAGVRAR